MHEGGRGDSAPGQNYSKICNNYLKFINIRWLKHPQNGTGFYGSNDATNSVKALKEGPKD